MDKEKEIQELVAALHRYEEYDKELGDEFHYIATANNLVKFAGYRKVPDGAIVLTKEEYERLQNLPEQVHSEMTERMKAEVHIEKRMGQVKADEVRKETAKDILGLYTMSDTFSSFMRKVMEKYGIEVDK